MPRTYQTKIEVQTTPEELWKALTEAEKIQSWFAPEVRVEPGLGGTLWSSWGPGMEGTSRLTAWEPNKHIQWTWDRPNREPHVTDMVIEADGAQTILRLVQSGFGDDASFDGEIESTSHAWPVFLLMLKHGLEHSYTRCENVTVFRMYDKPRAEVFQRFSPQGTVRHWDPVGYGCYEMPDMNRSIACIFCEGSGAGAMLTLTAILYDQPADRAEQVKAEFARLADA